MSLATAVGAPAPVTLAGKSYTASPVDLNGLGELEECARASAYSTAHKLAARLPHDQREAFLERATKQVTAVAFDTAEFNAYLMTRRGMETLLAVSLRPRLAGVTPDRVAAMVADNPADLINAVETVIRISGFATDDPEPKDGQKPGEGGQGAAAGLSQSSA